MKKRILIVVVLAAGAAGIYAYRGAEPSAGRTGSWFPAISN